jgi:hypothetical protein
MRRIVCWLWLMLVSVTAVSAAEPLRFNRDIRPILSENCFHCHGQDPQTREAGLRLDERAGALADLGGHAAVVPGDPAASELVRRMRSHDDDERMPPPASKKSIPEEQIALVERWIAEGAGYEPHWAYVPPERGELPAVARQDWPRRPLDRFVLARLEAEGLAPAVEAEPAVWLRRAALDLTGLPPTPAELDAFVADVAARGEAAYEAAADRLLASPHYGERQAVEWLDAARYADTHGFNNDSRREMWRWRDWVIESFNANQPYDAFITEQLAGDLLPDPTLEQRIATGFCRNHVINSEGGIIDEEYRVEYVADRVRTVSTAWLGLTMECARCHNHKFDTVSQRDYYSMFAFFNNVPEHGEDGRRANAPPLMPAPTRPQQARLEEQRRGLAELERRLELSSAAAAPQRDSVAAWLAGRPTAAGDRRPAVAGRPWSDGVLGNAPAVPRGEFAEKLPGSAVRLGGVKPATLSFWLRPAADVPADVPLLSSIDYGGEPSSGGYGKGRDVRLVDGEIEVRFSSRYPVYAVVVRTEAAAIRPGRWRQVTITHTGGYRAAHVRIFVDGTEQPLRVIYDGSNNVKLDGDWTIGRVADPHGKGYEGNLDELHVREGAAGDDEILADYLAEAVAFWEQIDPLSSRGVVLAGRLAEPERAEPAAAHRQLWAEHLALRRSLPSSMVMAELDPPRPTFVLDRGRYDAPGDPVTPAALEALLLPWPEDAPRNRLGLARWLTHPRQPLTGRVVVNRVWAQLFGTGIVKTLEDFGVQGEWPSHPALLDWLARDFIDGGWDLKRLFREIVLSATYRQTSAVPSGLVATDPENRLLARGPRVRLPAELIRDQALAVSGLLCRDIGGPSVYPYQPAGLYEGMVVDAGYPGTKWLQGKGDDLRRRSLYTFWKRTVPHPVMLTLDAPDREFCSVRRSRTNTPLQALLLWNEEGFLEAARHLGVRMWREGGERDADRLRFGMRLVTGRVPDERELAVLERTLGRLRAEFTASPADAERLLAIGESPRDESVPAAEQAAAMSVASMLLNLDETLTKD